MLRQVRTHTLDTIVSQADDPMSDHHIHLKYDFFNFIGLQVDLPYVLFTYARICMPQCFFVAVRQ